MLDYISGTYSLEKIGGGLILLYPFLIRGAYLLRQYFVPLYMQPVCLMELISKYDSVHYHAQPLWQYLRKNETCLSDTGVELDTFQNMIYSNGHQERLLVFGYVYVFSAIGLFFLMKEIVWKQQWKVMNSFPAMLVIAWFHMSTNFSIAHYQSDLTHLVGNLLHHSSLKLDHSNSVPPGVLFLHFLNGTTVCVVMYFILRQFNIPKKIYFSIYYFFFPIRHWFMNESVHIYIHKYKEAFFPWPLSVIAQVDYQSHINGHHVTGLGFGDYPGFGNVLDFIFNYHAMVFKEGWINFRSVGYYVFNIVFDYFIILCAALFMLAVAHVACSVLPTQEKKVQGEVKKEKVK